MTMTMGNILIDRYPEPTQAQRDAAGPDVAFPADYWKGSIVPDVESPKWAAFVRVDDTLEVVEL